LILVLAVLACSAAVGLTVDEEGGDREPELKAAIISKFPEFVEWPAEPPAGDAAFLIGIFGQDPIGDFLREATREKTVRSLPVVVREIHGIEEIPECEMVFISNSERDRLPEVLSTANGRPLLTVGDTEGFGERGVMINLYPYRDFIRFEVNMSSVQRSKLRFSAKLLKLARIIESEPTPAARRNLMPPLGGWS